MPILNSFRNHERYNKPSVRAATQEDIARLVDIDLECFDDVYADTPPTSQDIHEMLTDRLGMARDLMIVGEVNGRIEGFMTCQVTDKEPEDFVTWDETTDRGHLLTTHDANGKYFYIVNMTVTPEGSESHVGDMLIANMYGRFIEYQKEKAQLLSRIPQFSRWILEREINFEELDPADQDQLAESYLTATTTRNGKEVLYDGMLRRYGYAGAKPIKLVRDGFSDPASHDYGVLCVVENPLPKMVRRNKIATKLAGGAIRALSQKPNIVKKIF